MAANWTDQDQMDLAAWLALSPEMQIFEVNHSRTPELELPTAPLPILKDKRSVRVAFKSVRAGNHFNLCGCGELLPLEKLFCTDCTGEQIEHVEEADNWYISKRFKGFGQL